MDDASQKKNKVFVPEKEVNVFFPTISDNDANTLSNDSDDSKLVFVADTVATAPPAVGRNVRVCCAGFKPNGRSGQGDCAWTRCVNPAGSVEISAETITIKTESNSETPDEQDS